MSGVFGAVMERLAAGESPRAAARTLGIPADLAETVAAEAERFGLVIRAGAACGTCTPGAASACAGCPFAR
ncbi:hypothetical protein [Demequina mangrovi]|uniref:FeoC like transcriptional regulator n=1 Tax=Demequina mangrovi TaxID=1043493 RepID=A0A1H6XY37_9MICO|nr:hypothetical protein [Demequina mangrovi]SEJ33096.1 hypothetical protein SAMN05421637_1443 [Demequina mangrovi]